MVLYLARQQSGLTLAEIGEHAGGVEYKTVGKAVQRFARIIQEDKTLRLLSRKCLDRLSRRDTLDKIRCMPSASFCTYYHG